MKHTTLDNQQRLKISNQDLSFESTEIRSQYQFCVTHNVNVYMIMFLKISFNPVNGTITGTYPIE